MPPHARQTTPPASQSEKSNRHGHTPVKGGDLSAAAMAGLDFAVGSPAILTSAAVLQLQRSAGNRAVSRLFRRAQALRGQAASTAHPPAAGRLHVNHPGGPDEVQADQVARQVVDGPDRAYPPGIQRLTSSRPAIQRLVSLDGWKNRTTHDERETLGLGAIDGALEAWHGLPPDADIPALQRALAELARALDAWVPPKSMIQAAPPSPPVDNVRSDDDSGEFEKEVEEDVEEDGDEEVEEDGDEEIEEDGDEEVEEDGEEDLKDESSEAASPRTIPEAIETLKGDVGETIRALARIQRSQAAIGKKWEQVQPQLSGASLPRQSALTLPLKDLLDRRRTAWETVGRTPADSDRYSGLQKQVDEIQTGNRKLYDKSVEAQQAAQSQLKGWIEEGLKQDTDPLLKNSCEMIAQGRIKAFALQPTHDSQERALTCNKADLTAYFPANSEKDTYDPDDQSSTRNILFQPERFGGFAVDGKIYLMPNMMEKKSTVWRVLKHEVQHIADRHEIIEDPEIDPMESYKTEYRAYSYMGEKSIDRAAHDKAADSTQQPAGWAPGSPMTPRQLKILARYKDEYPSRYQTILGNPEFRAQVEAYRNPDTEGFNKFNSLRVDDFYWAVKEVRYQSEAIQVRARSRSIPGADNSGFKLWFNTYSEQYLATGDEHMAIEHADSQLSSQGSPKYSETIKRDWNYYLDKANKEITSLRQDLAGRTKVVYEALEKLGPEEKAFISQSKSYLRLFESNLPPLDLKPVTDKLKA